MKRQVTVVKPRTGIVPLAFAAFAIALLSGCVNQSFTLYSENDRYFAGTDRHYTNGAKFSYSDQLAHPEFSALGRKLDDLGRQLRVFEPPSVNGQPVDLKLSFSFGQDIYTPTEIHTAALITDDRPYAAWLYGAVAFQRQEIDLLQTIELQLGVIGPMALGREIQNGFHDLIGVAHAEGWGHQLRNEPGASLAYDWRYRWLRGSTSTQPDTGFAFDVIRRYGVTVGNPRTYLHGGPALRAGWNLPDDFGPDLIRSGGGSGALIRGASVFLFGSADARLVARDAFLDGNLFHHTSTVRKRPLVGDFSAGLAVYLGWLHLAYTQNYRTLEFYAQKQRDVFGSISVSVVR